MKRYAIAVHGGCGAWNGGDRVLALRGVRAAAQAARGVLERGGQALDAVCAAVVLLEDDPLFNAGTGCVLNAQGEAELDASVMCGDGLRCGGVAALQRVRNPVLVARSVMERTPHVLLCAAGALAFARREGFAEYDPVVRTRRSAQPGTVGAVALDARGRFAAATSTGGTSGKLPGRIGDSPIPGAGNYADARGAASATGNGELMMRVLAAKSACDAMTAGRSAHSAVRGVVSRIALQRGQSAALIAVDRAGRAGFAARGGRMPHAWFAQGDARIGARMECAPL